MYYRILDGDVRAQADDGSPIDLSPQQQHALVLLITARDHTVRSDALISYLGGGAHDARGAVRTLMSRLRGKLGDDADGHAFLPGEGGSDNHRYRLRLQPGDYIDLSVFRVMAKKAANSYETDPAMAALLLDEALKKWADPFLIGLPVTMHGLRTQLMNERLNAIELLAELQLWLGQSTHLALWLPDVVHANPGRESLRATLMNALDMAERRTEALKEYDDLVGQLRRDVGPRAGPGENLREIYERISAGRPAPRLRPVPVPAPDLAVRSSGGDPTVITTTRMTNYMANRDRVSSASEWHNAASRAAVEHLIAAAPLVFDLGIENERLRGRLARWFALEHEPKIAQLVEIGANVPGQYSLHGALGVIDAGALVAYFNRDLAVVEYSNRLLETEDGVTFSVGDLREPDLIISTLRKLGFDLAKPIGVIMLDAVNYTAPEEKPRELIRYITRYLAVGSVIAVNLVIHEGMTNMVAELIESIYKYPPPAPTLVPRSILEAHRMLDGDGLRLIEPVCDLGDWRPTRPSPPHGPMRAVIAIAEVVQR